MIERLSHSTLLHHDTLIHAYRRYGLWLCQAFLAAAFIYIGYLKYTLPIELLGQMWGWPGQFPPAFVRGMAMIDILGGLGVLLPVLTPLMPNSSALRLLSILAALGCMLLQIFAILFHFSRGEVPVLALNGILLALAALVLLGFISKPWETSRP